MSSHFPSAGVAKVEHIEYQKLEVQHQLLYAEEDRAAVAISPPPAHENVLAAIRRTRGIPTPPPAPAPAVLPDLWSAKAHPLKEELPGVANELLTRPKGSTSLPPAVQEEAVKAAKDMSKAISEKNPPLAPAAPAPTLVTEQPLWLPIEQAAAQAGKEMSQGHYPPLAPAAPAPELITRDATLSQPLQEQLEPAALKTMQNVEPVPAVIPDAPVPPAPMRLEQSQFVMSDRLKDDLALVVEKREQPKLKEKQKLDLTSARPVQARKIPPPLPPRPASSMAAMEAKCIENMAVHEQEKVIQHQPILEKQIINEHPVHVKHEHHIQPVVHQVEHQIQPIIKTQATTATTVIEKDKNVMLPPIVEPARIVTISTTPLAATQTMPTMESTQRSAGVGTRPNQVMMSGEGELESEERMGPGVVAPLMPGEKEILLEGLTKKQKKQKKKVGMLSPNTDPTLGGAASSSTSPNTATRGRRGSIGMKIKGAMKEVAGTITRNPVQKEEGKMLLHGIDPTSTDTSRV